jgi:hypothetical protein
MPTWGGRPVTHEEYAILARKNVNLPPPDAVELAHARHEDTGCTLCIDIHESYHQLATERDKLKNLRALYAVEILAITQALSEWARREKRAADGLDHEPLPSAEKRLEGVEKALNRLSVKGMKEWKK